MSWQTLNGEIERCTECPRLRAHCLSVAQRKKREFMGEPYWGRPVVGFGDRRAKAWIVGLAPAAHGANRTGRMFTGDSSGRWLYRALHEAGLSTAPESTSRTDNLLLHGVFISAAGRCAPPDNKPLPMELERCFRFLVAEWSLLERPPILLALGQIAFKTCLKLLRESQVSLPSPLPTFSHGAEYQFGRVQLIASYHPSRQNTQTGRLTPAMWSAIFTRLAELLKLSL